MMMMMSVNRNVVEMIGKECSGSIVVTTLDCGPGGPKSQVPSGCQYSTRLDRLHRANPGFHPFGVVHRYQSSWTFKAVTGACKWIDGCSQELCSATPSVALSGICHINKVNSIAWLYHDGLAMRYHEIVSVTKEMQRLWGWLGRNTF